jgi:7-keto-8-aminopelargonate synthetase-like enzyme
MASKQQKDLSPVHSVELVDAAMQEATSSGLFMQTASSEGYTGRHVTVDGADLLNFGSCSYLGLEKRIELRLEAERALRNFGTQFSFSRGYLQSDLYVELEQNLATMTGGKALVVPTTTLGHISTLPVLVGPRDFVFIDQFAHASLQLAVGLLHGIPVQQLRHERIAQLRDLAGKLSHSHERIWYVCDGLYSMRGNLASIEPLLDALSALPNLYLYIDDAHSTSWLGAHGRGHALGRLSGHERVVVALSLNKAFAAAGAAIVFPDMQSYAKVRRCGGPMLFSGPVQPPMLGAAVASSRLHLSPEFASIQAAELASIRAAREKAAMLGVPFACNHPTPIFFVPCGSESAAFDLVRALRTNGFYTCASVFPAVPRKRAGVRFTISSHNTAEDIASLISTLAGEMVRLGIPLTASQTHPLKNAS